MITCTNQSASQHGLGSHPLKRGLKLLREGSLLIFDNKDHLPNKADAIVQATPPRLASH